MAWPGFRSTPADSPGLEVWPDPGQGEMYWREVAFAKAPAPVVATRTPDLVEEEEGTATARFRLLSEDPYSAGAELELSWGTIWSVVLVDSLKSELCASKPPLAPVSGEAIAFFGAGSAMAYHSNALYDLDGQLSAELETNRIAPGGASGEALFTNIYLALSFATTGAVYVTPILDGERLTAERTAVFFDNGGDGRKRQDFEVGLGRTIGNNRQGLRGTWLAVHLEIVDLGECGPLFVEGLEVEAEVVTEGVEDRSFTEEHLQERSGIDTVVWFFGAGPKLLQGDSGSSDDGADVEARAETNAVAPAGVGGEAIFTNLYLTIQRDVATDLELLVTPLLDGEEQDSLSLTLPATTNPVREEHEFGLSLSSGIYAYAMRGTSMAVRVETTGALPQGRVVIEGVDVEAEIVTEGTEASNAS